MAGRHDATSQERQELRVLLVEDSQFDREVYRQMLTMDNARAVSLVMCETGQQAMDYVIAQSDIDAVLIDLQLPDMNGMVLIRHFAAQAPVLPIIVLTAEESEHVATQAIQAGADDYLVKGQTGIWLLQRTIRYAIERKRSRQENANLAGALEHEKNMNKQQREFMSMVSHEFRTPMAIASSSLQLLDSKLSEPQRGSVAKHLDKIRQSISRLNEIVESAMRISLYEAGKAPFSPTLFDIAELLDSCARKIMEITPQSHVKIEGAEHLPSHYHGDAALLEQVFLNVIGNAVKYSPETRAATVRISSSEQQLCIAVEDHGVGIAQEEIAKLGEKFYRASNTSGIAGSGIGLHLARAFLAMHEGALRIESELGSGTSVYITLPMLQEAKVTRPREKNA